MNILKLIKDVTEDINSADIVAYILFVSTMYNYFSTNDEIGSLYLGTLALFFFGISYIVDAISNIETKVIVVTDPSLTVKISDTE